MKQLLPLGVVELLGVIQPLKGESLRKDHCGGYHRTGKRPPSGLIDTRHGTDAKGMETFFVIKRRAPQPFSLGAPLRV